MRGTFGPSLTPSDLLFNGGTGLAGTGDNDLFVSAVFPDGGYGVLDYSR